jgi:hypothetical protein
MSAPVKSIAEQFGTLLQNVTKINANKHRVAGNVEVGKAARTLAYMQQGQRR